ncbi:MAG TPA: hypothetical protein VHR66_01415 [Gemmataceae bacterium]|jgi:hypothetical protein|nr:hypothetical protein [Gemmataceae bacterium]
MPTGVINQMATSLAGELVEVIRGCLRDDEIRDCWEEFSIRPAGGLQRFLEMIKHREKRLYGPHSQSGGG